MEQQLYRYMASLVRVVDGDTLDLLIDTGFHHSWQVNCRLAHINAPELDTDDGKKSKAYLVARLPVGTEVYIISRSLDKYGRPIADVFLNDVNINKEMVDKGFAVKYM